MRIPESPYGGHPAGKRWFLSRYENDLAALKGHSVNQLRTIVGRTGEVSLLGDADSRSDQEAHDQAAIDALSIREQGTGLHNK